MYYKYSSITGRLIRSTYQKAYVPQGFQTLAKSEPINPFPPTYPVAVAPVLLGRKSETGVAQARSSSSASAKLTPSGEPFAPVSDKLKKLQEKFQKDDGVPVHLKGGPMDKVLYYLTLGLCVVGVAKVLQVIYLFSFPRKVKTDD